MQVSQTCYPDVIPFEERYEVYEVMYHVVFDKERDPSKIR